MLHLACSFRLTLVYEYMSRAEQIEEKTKQKQEEEEEGWGGQIRPTSSSLRISDCPQVSRSCRACDQKLSSWFMVPWQRGGLTNLWQRRNQNMRAALPSRHRWCSMGKAGFLGSACWRIPLGKSLRTSLRTLFLNSLEAALLLRSPLG